MPLWPWVGKLFKMGQKCTENKATMINPPTLKLKTSVHQKISAGEWKGKPQSGRRDLLSD